MPATIAEQSSRRARRNLPALALEATVVAPPLTSDGFMRVVVDAQPGRVRECPWTPRPIEEPSEGDAALVIESDQGNLWAVVWWPQ